MDITACFLAWLERTRLPVDVIIEQVRPGIVSFGLTGWPSLSGSLRDTGIDIYALRFGEWWDILWCNDVSARNVADGWVCWLCLDAAENGLYPQPPRYGTPEDLWIAHTFEAFRQWQVEDLAKAEGIGYWGETGYATWARLVFAPGVRENGSGDGAVEVVKRV